MLSSVDRILMRVPSVDSAVAYYRDVLGMKLLRHDGRIACFVMNDGVTELVVHADPDLPDQATYLRVDSVADIYQKRNELRLKFSGPPQPITRGLRATARDPFGNVLLLLDRSADPAPNAIEDAKAPLGLFAGVEHRVSARPGLLIELYTTIARTADDLPYTPHFESIYNDYAAQLGEPAPTRQEVWRHLLNLRKGGKLPKLGPARSSPPDVTPQDRLRLREMLGDAIGRRDRLPYTPQFDQIVEQFNRALTRKLSPHLIWRLLATLAK